MSTKKELMFRRGKHLNLRLLDEGDAPTITRWMNDEEIAVFLARSLPMRVEKEIEWIKKIADDENNLIFGIETVGGQFIGVMGLHQIDKVHRTAQTGAAIGEKTFWGRGYGTEAKLLLLKYAFDTLNLRKINSDVIEFNKRSVNYLKKAGYEIEGSRKKQYFKDGKYWDEINLAVYRPNWLPIWEKYKKTGNI